MKYYIKFHTEAKLKPTVLEFILSETFISLVPLPQSNKLYDYYISKICVWYLSFEDCNSPPSRELGFNDCGELLFASPYLDNSGYWTDSNMMLVDFFKMENLEIVSEDQFCFMWGRIDLDIMFNRKHVMGYRVFACVFRSIVRFLVILILYFFINYY